MARLWRNTDDTREGKYLVLRRDGTVPEAPYFVMMATDPAAPQALLSYARAAAQESMDPDYCQDIIQLAHDFEAWRERNGAGDPDAPRHREDAPWVIELMKQGHGS